MHWHIKHTNITRDWVPAAWLSGRISRVAGEGQEPQGPSQTESSLTGVSLPIEGGQGQRQTTGTPPAVPAQECLGRTWKYAHTCVHQDLSLLLCRVQRWPLVGISLEKWEPKEGSGELCGLREAMRAAARTCSREEHLLQKVQSWTNRSVTEPAPHAHEDSSRTAEPTVLSRQLAD